MGIHWRYAVISADRMNGQRVSVSSGMHLHTELIDYFTLNFRMAAESLPVQEGTHVMETKLSKHVSIARKPRRLCNYVMRFW